MYHYILKKKGRFILFIFLLIVSGVMGTLFSMVMSSLIDSATKSVETLLFTLLFGVGFVVLYVLIDILYSFIKNKIQIEARYELKKDVFSGIISRGLRRFESENSAEYINELSNNLELLEGLYFANSISAMEMAVSFLSAAVICLVVQPMMLVVMLVLAVITLGSTKVSSAALQKSTEERAAAAAKYLVEIKDDFGGFRLIRGFGMFPYVLKKHEERNREAENARCKNMNRQVLCADMGALIGLLSTVIVMAVAAYFALNGLISAGMIIAFGHLIGNIVSPITSLPMVIANFQAAKPLGKRYKTLLEKAPEEGTKEKDELKNDITLQNVSFGYGPERQVLDSICYKFEMGKHYAVVGSSGSGKSTLLALLQRYFSDYEGAINFDGMEQKTIKSGCLEKMLGAAEQSTFLFNDTLYHNITLFDETYTKDEVDNAVAFAGLADVVRALPEGLSTMLSENGKNFSGGEKQRVGLARVLLRNRKVLILDEYGANLDEQTEREIEERLAGKKDCLVISVTHRLKPQVLRLYDEIIVMKDGRIVESGSFAELVSRGGEFCRLKDGQ